MKLTTVDELSDILDKEISWRRVELTTMKFSVKCAKGQELNTRLRASLVLLYAHWEGFVKKALTYYLQFVSNQKLVNRELNHCFFAIELKYDLKLFSESKKNTVHTQIVNDMFDKLDEISNIPYKKMIDTKSNLKSELFVELMKTVGLDYSDYETEFALIDTRLLKVRNEIAHGEAMQALSLTQESYLELHEKIITIVDRLREQIIESARNKNYMKLTSPSDDASAQFVDEINDSSENNKILLPI
ncbi:MAG: MAE_28990/MAE_18760 family HEPN-like nuclease [Oscillospiraceae bacterium]|nr:MAE_28990/MAE_18760 family HEPN-like nuclease [Oscillospiraceae bacterium]